ncbi:hypothetical protein CCACVL1_20223 [Corchorus capsularis]|uniref:Steroid 5-alpha reductase C-terminal domain-containing protein n=1 Tax=Corchorus capsularis TaxID=210143 RepID=A0A1R3HCF2_COCAP|nr:hypothetical protein CCACVL1_20223 [Corchorus capsularis]
MSFLMKFLYPPSIFVTATTLVSFSILVTNGLSEIRGKSMQYSKFAGVKNSVAESKKRMISSRAGMIMLYTPAFLAGLSSFAIFLDEGFRFYLLKSAITIHYLKRVMESSFVHKYSGEMALGTMIVILSSYFSSSVFMIVAQHLTMGIPEPAIDLKNPGILLFLVGIIGNFYHHIRLSKLRSGTGKGAKEYKIPKGDFPKGVKAIIPFVF